MKTKYLFLFCILYFNVQKSFGQGLLEGGSFALKGKTNDQTLDSVSIIYINGAGKIIQESVPATGGAFSITGLINQPTFSYLVFKHKGEVIGRKDVEQKRNAAYLHPGEMTISKVPAPNGYLEIAGAPEQIKWKELYGKTDKQEIYAYFMANPSSYVTADRVKYYTSVYSLDSIKALYNKYSKEIKESVDGKRLAAEIKSREVGVPGTMAFAFNVKDKDEKELSLAAMKGKYVLLDFWATWCVPCRASMPHMIGLYKRYKDKNFIMIGIGDDDKNVKNWLAAIEKDGTGLWPQTLRGLNSQLFVKGIDNPRDLGQQYGVRALPTKILIDPDGKIIGRFDGQHGTDEEMENMLAGILAK